MEPDHGTLGIEHPIIQRHSFRGLRGNCRGLPNAVLLGIITPDQGNPENPPGIKRCRTDQKAVGVNLTSCPVTRPTTGLCPRHHRRRHQGVELAGNNPSEVSAPLKEPASR